jgi:hypothetical protein
MRCDQKRFVKYEMQCDQKSDPIRPKNYPTSTLYEQFSTMQNNEVFFLKVIEDFFVHGIKI